MFDDEPAAEASRPISRAKTSALKALAESGSNYKMRSKADKFRERMDALFEFKRKQMLGQRLNNIPLAPVIKYAIAGDEYMLKNELNKGYHCDTRDPFNGRTALHEACGAGHYHIVRALLLEYRADPNVQTVIGHSTALHIAAERGYRQIASILITSGADANQLDEQGCTPLHVATKLSVVKLLFKATRVDPTARNLHGQTALEKYLTSVPPDDQDKDLVDFMRQQEDQRMVEVTREKLQQMKLEKNEQLRLAAMVTSANSTVSSTRKSPSKLWKR